MRKSLIITVVIALLCLCGCEAVVTVPESPEPTKASEMLLTTTAAEESTDNHRGRGGYTMSNSLASVHPELISEWSEKNLPLTPDKITFGSNKRVWWMRFT